MFTVHSLIFKHHPYFDGKFREGRIDFPTSETKDTGRGVQDFQLWFMFNSKRDAMNAFNKLSSMFNKFSKIKKIATGKDKIIASYTDKGSIIIKNQ